MHNSHKCSQHVIRRVVSEISWMTDGRISLKRLDNPLRLLRRALHHSHEIPVQLIGHQLLQQRLEASLEEHLEAEVVLDDQGGVQTSIYDLHTNTKTHTFYTCKHIVFLNTGVLCLTHSRRTVVIYFVTLRQLFPTKTHVKRGCLPEAVTILMTVYSVLSNIFRIQFLYVRYFYYTF